MRKSISLIMAIIVPLITLADGKVTFTAIAPDTVSINEQFTLKFKVTLSKPKTEEFKYIDTQHFEVIAGPIRALSSTMVFDGKSVVTYSNTYSYILQSNQAGNFTIPKATISVDNVIYHSNSLQIKVLPKDKADDVNKDMDVFVTTDISKTSLYLHETTDLSYKLYTNITTIDSIAGATPELSRFKVGFEGAEWKQEQYNGKDYQTCIFCQYT